MLKLVIIILNYKTPKLVQECLSSIATQIEGLSARVVVVDNASPDNSQEEIANTIKQNNWEAWCELKCSPRNAGFAAGNNLGIKSIKAEAYLLLNSDTVVKNDAISILIEKMDSSSELGIISCHLEGPHGEWQTKKFRFISPLSELILTANIGLLSKFFKCWQVPILENDNTPAEWVCFAAVLIRKSVFDKIGLLDEGYFMYYEDVDFCRRAQLNSIDIGVCEEAKIVHLIGASSNANLSIPSRQKRRPAYYYKARNKYFKRYYRNTFTANLFWLAGRIVSIIISPLRRSSQTSYEKDYLDIWTH